MLFTASAARRSIEQFKRESLHFPYVGRSATRAISGVAVRSQSDLRRELLRTADVAVAVAAFGTAVALTGSGSISSAEHDLFFWLTLQDLALLAAIFIFWPVLLTLFGLYSPRISTWGLRGAARIAGACSVGVLTVLFFMPSDSRIAGGDTLLFFWAGALVATVSIHQLRPLRFAAARQERVRKMLIVGSGPLALRAHAQLMAGAGPTHHELVGFVDSTDGLLTQIGHQRLGTLDDLERILMRSIVDQVLIALPVRSCYAEIQDVIDLCERVGIEARYPADCFRHASTTVRYEMDGSSLPLVSIRGVPDDPRLTVKRALDASGAAIGLVLLAPLLLAIGALIRLSSPGPVLFVQTRYGYNKRPFRMYKFRTMVVDAEVLQASLEALNEADGPAFKIRRDPRVTPLGRLLRRTSLDEMPQLFNVLKGEMSLVGPRPLPVRDVHRFSEAWLMRRFSVRPGCTCLWQISGRSNLSFDDWITLDLHYIDQWSLRLDLEILLRTVPAVLRGNGAA